MRRFCVLVSGCVFLIVCLMAAPAIDATDSDSIIVYGIGYPPIKAQSKVQAFLMAKRAAILDAYRNAIRASSNDVSEAYDDKTFYERISGFVKGMKIMSEEYLDDGGVRIKAFISLKDISLLQKEQSSREKEDFIERKGGPERVTIEEWYKIISGMVRFENKI